MSEIQTLPAFNLPAFPAGQLSSQILHGQYVVIYFYPKDNTSGCTVEATEFTGLYPRFRKLGAEIVGVSRDSLRAHEKFVNKVGIPYPLVSDEDEVLCRAFDVLREKSLYGRKYVGIDRSTFLFDRAGRLRESWRGVTARGHAQMVLDRLEAHRQEGA